MFRYLLHSRLRPGVLTKLWVKVWLKRAYHGPALLKIIFFRARLEIRGSKIGAMTLVDSQPARHNLNRLSIGSNSVLGKGVTIALHDRVSIGNFVVINSGVRLITGSHDLSDPAWTLVTKPIFISDYAWIATGAIILPGVTVGRGAVIGAGSVVRRDVADWEIVFGNPATPHGRNRVKTLHYNPVRFTAPIEAWLGPDELRNNDSQSAESP